MPHMLGARGDIIAILWAPKNALWAPPLPDRNNKILWVSRVPTLTEAPMLINATLAGTAVPAPRCWIMHVTWAGNTDLVRLRYAARRSKPAART